MEKNVVTKPTVFISYSHKDEAWKDRLVTHLGVLAQEGLLDTWEDRRIWAGADWNKEIEEALKKASVAVLLISADFLTSKFILGEEVPKLLERRETEGLRIFPVIIKPCTWEQVKWLSRMNLRPKDAKPLMGETDFQIETDMTAIAGEIAGIVGQFNPGEFRDIGRKDNNDLDIIYKADKLLDRLLFSIISILHNHHKDKPLSITNLFEELKNNYNFTNVDQLFGILQHEQKLDHLPGIVMNSQKIFMEEEHFAIKSRLYTDAKEKIAIEAIKYIESGNTIALDAGSTTLEISRQISHKLKTKDLKNLKIVTNSIPAANELINTATEMGLDDNTSILTVYMVSGRIRPNTLAVVNDKKIKVKNNFECILSPLHKANICFVGTNGIHKVRGFTTHDDTEVETKHEILMNSRRRFIVTDPSKFDVQEEKTFSKFDKKIEIITIKDNKFEKMLKEYETFFSKSLIKIVYA